MILMRQKIGWYMLALLFLAGAAFLFPGGARAAGTSVTVTPNASDATAAVTVSDAELNGKEISVICYAPGIRGSVNDITANRDLIVYMNQYTVNGTASFSFRVKRQLVSGEYTLVVSSEKGQVTTPFRFVTESTKEPEVSAKPAEASPARPTATAAPAGTVKKTLAAPGGVKAKSSAKKKITVTWKKVKGAKGYQIRTAKKKKGKYSLNLTVKGGSKQKATLKGLKSGKVYYIRVNAYKLSGKKKVAGKNSKVVKVKVR